MCWSRRDWRKQVKQKEKRKKKKREKQVCMCPRARCQNAENKKKKKKREPKKKKKKKKREPILLCTDDPVSDTSIKCPDAKPNQDQYGRASKDSDRRMYVLYMQ
ncbi:hypothetical protein ACN38_g10651 [Penicillium nordicum]|uniref:Uncharacterized protein n=1 Tax=Penicillium nordicum TaxID=229535 RepID=A0A0M8P1J6_9EURO|nr:hypothetical protein ACN38_g10651 [Penicillium nordicum]